MHEDVESHLDRLDRELDRWSGRVADGMSERDFVTAARADAGEEADRYDRVAPLWQSYLGMKRYWDSDRS